MEDTLQELRQTIVKGDRIKAVVLTQTLLATGAKPKEILDLGLIAGMETVGELFKQGQYYVPEMLIAARAMKEALQKIWPLLTDTGVEPVGKVVNGDHIIFQQVDGVRVLNRSIAGTTGGASSLFLIVSL